MRSTGECWRDPGKIACGIAASRRAYIGSLRRSEPRGGPARNLGEMRLSPLLALAVVAGLAVGCAPASGEPAAPHAPLGKSVRAPATPSTPATHTTAAGM